MQVRDRVTSVQPSERSSLAWKFPAPDRLAQFSVVAFACFVALLVLVAAFFTDRNGDVDELMMHNPSYMLAHFGKLTFPTYSYRAFYDQPVVIHPPIHVGSIGLLEKLGFTWYYAEAIPTVLFLLVGILVIVFSMFPAPVKLGLLMSIGFVAATGDDFAVIFGTRPEGEVHAAWFAGLLLLESGRLANWNRARLFAGAFLLTWASGVHYYACAALAGIVVYVVWAVHDLGWKDAESRVAALIAGGCLFGIPYVALYLRPHLKQILWYVRLTTGQGGVATAIRTHFYHYQTWSHANYIPSLVRRPMGLGVPLVVFSTLILGVIKPTRGIALAALPLQIFVFFFAAHKLPLYLVHEIVLFVAAAGVGALVLCDLLWRRIPWPGAHAAFLPTAAALLCFYLATNNATLTAATIYPLTHVHEGDLARAATREILGPHARVTGRDGGWYTSGADYWYDIERDMLLDPHYDATSFFSNFDAAIDYAHQSDTSQSATISSWYADGTLKLRGFYFGDTNEQLQVLLLSAQRTPRITGYAVRNGQLYRFEEKAEGDFQVLSAACPMVPQLERWQWFNRWPETFSAALYLPKPAPGAPAVVATVLARRDLREPAGWMHTACRQITVVNGTLKPADKHVLLEKLRHEDTPIHFPRFLEDMPGYTGVLLPEVMRTPKDSIRVEQVLRLDEIRALSETARVERLPQIRVTTVPGLEAFSASIPVTHTERAGTGCWLYLRVKVIHGEIGLAALGPRGMVARTPLPILKSTAPLDVALPLPNLADVNQIMIFNYNEVVGAQVDVLDAAALFAPDGLTTASPHEHSSATASGGKL